MGATGLGTKIPKGRPMQSRPKAKLPYELPGRFFIIVYRRYAASYTIHMDAPDNPSYDLGSNMDEIVRRFRMWKQEELGCRAVDMAREFGKSQAIIKSARVLSLHRHAAVKQPDVFDKPERKSYGLPCLA